MNPSEIGVGLAAVFFFTALSARMRLLTKGGTLAALFVGTLVTVFGGLSWLALLLTFHVAAGILTRFHYDAKLKIGTAESKGGARSWTNVFANGGVAAAFAVLEGIFRGEIFFGGFLGALSSAASDTLATEVGTLYPHKPRLITRIRKTVRAGTSGALSPYGEVAIVLAAVLLGFIAFLFQIESWVLGKTLLIAISAGFLGSTADSLLGATLQAKYVCPSCSEETEMRVHSCGRASTLKSGTPLLNNHSVNLVSTLIGAVIGVALALTL